MKFADLLDNLLLEHVRKIGDRYYIYSHKNPNKRLGKKEGYGSRGAAVHSMMMIASHGGFAKNKHKGAVIRNYEKRHGE